MSPTIVRDIYHLVRQFQDEKHRQNSQDSVRKIARQESVFSTNSFVIPFVVFTSVLVLQTASLYIGRKHQIEYYSINNQHENRSCNNMYYCIMLSIHVKVITS